MNVRPALLLYCRAIACILLPMKDSRLVGTTWIGNRLLLDRELVGIFASARSDALMARHRDLWAIEEGQEGAAIVGVFRNLAERSILENLLRHGGRAVWIVDHMLPTMYSDACSQAMVEGRLLVVSCFWTRRSLYSTTRYCSHLVMCLATRLVMWAPVAGGFIPQLMARALRQGKQVDVLSGPYYLQSTNTF